jgi:hypothetical protein
MAYDCIHNPYSRDASINSYLATTDDVPLPEVGGRQSDVSTITETTTTATNVFAQHPFKNNPEREKGGEGRPIRRTCKAPKCNKTYGKKCFHPICLDYSYESPHGTVYGLFYCPDHQYLHYENVLRGSYI